MNPIKELKKRYSKYGKIQFENIEETDVDMPYGWYKVRLTFSCNRATGIAKTKEEAQEIAASKILLKMAMEDLSIGGGAKYEKLRAENEWLKWALSDVDISRLKLGLTIIKNKLEKLEWTADSISAYDITMEMVDFEQTVREMGMEYECRTQRGMNENVVVMTIQEGPSIIETEIGVEELEDVQLKVMMRAMHGVRVYLEKQIGG